MRRTGAADLKHCVYSLNLERYTGMDRATFFLEVKANCEAAASTNFKSNCNTEESQVLYLSCVLCKTRSDPSPAFPDPPPIDDKLYT